MAIPKNTSPENINILEVPANKDLLKSRLIDDQKRADAQQQLFGNNQESKQTTTDANTVVKPTGITTPSTTTTQPTFSKNERLSLTLLPLASALLQGKRTGSGSLLGDTLASLGTGLMGTTEVALKIKELEGKGATTKTTAPKQYKLQPGVGKVQIGNQVFTPEMGRIISLDDATKAQYPVDTFVEVEKETDTQPKFETKKFTLKTDVKLADGTEYKQGQTVDLLPKDSVYIYDTYGTTALSEVKDLDPPTSLKPISFMVDIFQKGKDDIDAGRRFSFGQSDIAKAFLLAEAESKPKRVTIKLPGGVEEQRIVRDLDYVKNLKNIYGEEVFEQLWTYANLGEDFYAQQGDTIQKSEAAQAALERPINYDALRTGKSSDIVISRRVNLPDAAKKTLASASSVIQDLANVRQKLFKDGKVQRDILLTPNKVKVLKSGAVSYARSMQRAVETLLRQRSGAAITKQEFDRYQNLYVPTTFDTDEVIKQKLLAMEREFGTIIKLIKSDQPVQIYDNVNDIIVDAENNGMTLENQWKNGIFQNNKTIPKKKKDDNSGGSEVIPED
jgi:hypothetical protein